MIECQKSIDELVDENKALRDRLAILEQSEKENALIKQNLMESQKKYKHLVENMNEGLLIRNKDDSIEFVNDKLCQMWGYTREEILKHSMTYFLDEVNQSIVKRQLSKRAAGAEESYEISVTGKNGQLISTIVSPKPVFEDNGKYRGTLVVVTDITARKKAEQELGRKAEELERSNKELEQFAYVASHDLQEPLRKIQAFGDRLKTITNGHLSERGYDYLQRMQNAAGRMQRLINDLMSFSRVTTHTNPFVSVNLDEIARDCISNLEWRIEKTSASVEVGPLGSIEADKTQMHQLMQNLISNALKFHQDGTGVKIRIYGEHLDELKIPCGVNCKRNGYFRYYVEDNGIGFDEKYVERIFGVFQRLHGRGKYEGTGIGLAICRKITDRHEGSIDAKSTPGEGGTFIVTLPVTQRKPEESR